MKRHYISRWLSVVAPMLALLAVVLCARYASGGNSPEPPAEQKPEGKETPKVQKYDKNMRPDEGVKEELSWHSPTEPPFRLAGFAWFEKDRVYRRLPVVPPAPLPRAVNALANATAGGQIQFQTDSPKIAVRVKLAGAADMAHMPATGQCGFDLYVGPPKHQLFCSVTKYNIRQTEYEVTLLDLPESEMRNVTLDFPLYQGVKEVLVGLRPDARVETPPPYDDDRPIVVYGTSITQGGCASRPGMAYTNILSRRFNRPFINLGFSGRALGEPEVAMAMAQIPDPACYVLDYEINVDESEKLDKTLPQFIRILREAHPDVPILVPSRIRYPWENLRPAKVQVRLERGAFQRETVEKLRAAGDRNVYFFDATDAFGDAYNECTVDSLHPNDLGFWLMAKAFGPELEKILEP